MLFDLEQSLFINEPLQKYSGEYFTFYFTGFVFLDGLNSGPESLTAFDSLLEKDRNAIKKIYGSFFIIAVHRVHAQTFAFTDNSGMIKAYRYQNFISDSFLELINFITGDLHLNYRDLAHFLHFGIHLPDSTFFNEIEVFKRESIVESANGRLKTYNKNLAPLHEKSNLTMESFFHSLSIALKNLNTTVDLSGGFDSRLNAVFLHHYNLQFRTSLSGQFSNKDYKIAKKVAAVLGIPFDFYNHSIENLNLDTLKAIITETDGQIDVLSFHRNYGHLKERLSKGAQIMIHGAGGEMFKDFWWLHDFPFYNKRKTNLEKLYSLRIESISFPHSILKGKLKRESQELKSNLLDRFSIYSKETNTKTLDQIYFNYKMAGFSRSYLSVNNKFLMCYAPLMEYELVQLGYNLPRKKRFMSFFHKQKITKLNRKVSRIITTDSTSASSIPFYLILDFFLFFSDSLKRLAKQIFRKLFHRNIFMENPNHHALSLEFSKIINIHIMFIDFKIRGLVHENVNFDEISPEIKSRLFTFYQVAKMVNGNVICDEHFEAFE